MSIDKEEFRLSNDRQEGIPHPLRWLISAGWNETVPCLMAIVSIIAMAIANLAHPWILKVLIDDVMVDMSDKSLWDVCLSLSIVALVAALSLVGQQYGFSAVGEQVAVGISRIILGRLQRQSVDTVRKRSIGDIVSHFTSDIPAIQRFFVITAGELLGNLLRISITVVILFSMSWELTVISAVVVGVFVVWTILVGRYVRDFNRATQQMQGVVGGELTDILVANEDIRAFGMEEHFNGRAIRSIKKVSSSRHHVTISTAVAGSVARGLRLLGSISVLWIGGNSVLAGELSPGTLVAFVLYLERLFGPAFYFVTLHANAQASIAAVDRLGILLSDCDMGGGLKIPSRGRVRINNVDQKYWRKELGRDLCYVPQRSRMFPGTIRDNIRFGREWLSDSQVLDAASLCGLEEMLEEFEEGLDTMVGTGGIALSGGQLQKAIFARAVASKPRYLFLDEATSALDQVTEQRLIGAVLKYLKESTIVIVTHRQELVTMVDTVLLMHNGQLLDCGPADDVKARHRCIWGMLHDSDSS